MLEAVNSACISDLEAEPAPRAGQGGRQTGARVLILCRQGPQTPRFRLSGAEMSLGCRGDEDLLPAYPGKEASPGRGVSSRERGASFIPQHLAWSFEASSLRSCFGLRSELQTLLSSSTPHGFSSLGLETSLVSACHISQVCLQAGLLLPEPLQWQPVLAVTEPTTQLPGRPSVTRWVTA